MRKWVAGDDLRKSIAELIATFVFVLIAVGAIGAALGLNAASKTANAPDYYLVAALASGIGIMLGVMTVGRISGAHMNPAVTVASIVTGNTGVIRGVLYIVAQLIGAVLAVAVLNSVNPHMAKVGMSTINAVSVTTTQAVLVEGLLTFILVWTIFATTVDKRANTLLAPLAIGLVMVAGHLMAMGVTGASLNPARSFGPAAIVGNFSQHWVYWVGPIVGGVLAALVYGYLFGEKEAGGKGLIKIKLKG